MAIFPTDDPQYAETFAAEAAMVDASELIAAALERSGMTQAQLARALRVSRSEITARLRGERNITLRSLALTLHAMGERLTLSSAPSGAADTDTQSHPIVPTVLFRSWAIVEHASSEAPAHVSAAGWSASK
jgi:transcriptional regulator with XRE-family HTH domain